MRTRSFRPVQKASQAGKPVSVAQQEFPQHFPKPGWVEHDPHDIWRSQRDTAHAVLELARAVGHRDLRMLQAYYNESAEDLAKKLK